MNISILYILLGLTLLNAALLAGAVLIGVLLIDRTSQLKPMATKLDVMEECLSQVLGDILAGDAEGQQIITGHMSAEDLEHLMDHMSTDSHTENVPDEVIDKDLDDLRQFFKKSTNEENTYRDKEDDEDGDDTNDKPWLK